MPEKLLNKYAIIPSMGERALFLDRDGIMCHLIEYAYGFDSVQRVEDVRLVSGIDVVINCARENKWPVFEVSNQPGVALGKQTQELSDAIEARVHELLHEAGVSVDTAYICPHDTRGVVLELSINCDCCKPKPGMLYRAAQEHNVDLNASMFYGDKATDVQAAIAAGCKSMLLLHREDEPEKVLAAYKATPDYRVYSHQEACEILKDFN